MNGAETAAVEPLTAEIPTRETRQSEISSDGVGKGDLIGGEEETSSWRVMSDSTD
jgi:hypothetical protein